MAGSIVKWLEALERSMTVHEAHADPLYCARAALNCRITEPHE